jgi:hypothetical protein
MAKIKKDEFGKYVELVAIWMGPSKGYQEFPLDSPEAKEVLKQQLLINLSRKKNRTK